MNTQTALRSYRYLVLDPDGTFEDGYDNLDEAAYAFDGGAGHRLHDTATATGTIYEPGDWPETEEPTAELMTASETHAHVASLIRQSRADHDTAVMLAERAKAIFGVDIAPANP